MCIWTHVDVRKLHNYVWMIQPVKEVMLQILVVILATQAKYSFLCLNMMHQYRVTFDRWTDKEVYKSEVVQKQP